MKISKILKTYGIILAIVIGSSIFSPAEPFDCENSQFLITDDMGETIAIDGPLPRIISLYVGHTENLISLGAGGSVIATGHEIGDLGLSVPVLSQKPGIEQIIALSPDVVLTRPMMARSQESLYGALRAMGIRVMAFDPPAWDEFPEYIETLRKIAGGETPKNSILDMMAEREDVPRRKLSVFLVTNGRTMATCTENSWAAHIMKLAGFENAASGAAPLAKGSVVAGFGPERLLASGDEIDVILLQQGAMNTMRSADFKRDPRFTALRAVREGMVFDVSEADISRPSLLRLESGVVTSLREMVYAGGRFDE